MDVRFQGEEPCRHAVMDVMGDLALLAPPGGSGLPMGHVVAFNADHALVMDFVIRVAEAIEAGHVEEFPFMMLPSEVLLPAYTLLHSSKRAVGSMCNPASCPLLPPVEGLSQELQPHRQQGCMGIPRAALLACLVDMVPITGTRLLVGH